MSNNKKEVRFQPDSIRIEQREGETGMTIEGYAAVYDSETLIGDESWGFYETIAKGAFDKANMKDVVLRYNHLDGFACLARTRNKSLVLTPDEKGLHVKAELLDTQDAKDMYTRIKAGLVDKMSFAFTVPEDGEDVRKDDKGVMHRTINKFDCIFDVSVVDFPAYEDTSIYARSRELVEARCAALDSDTGADLELEKAKNHNILF